MIKYRLKTIGLQLILFIVYASLTASIQGLLPNHWIKATLLFIFSIIFFFMLVVFPLQSLYNEGIINSNAGKVSYTKHNILHFVIGLYIVLSATLTMSMSIHVPTAQTNIMSVFAEKGVYYTVFTVLSMCIVQPVLEELLFRYSFMTFNADTPKNVKNTFVFTGFIVFALLHLLAGSSNIWLASIVYLFASFGLSYIYLKTKNIRLSILAHILNNSLAMLLLMFS